MFVGVLYVLASVLTSVCGTCQSVDGQSVPWWILYQQKDRPYFHQYVDSTNSHRIKEHYPEKVNSVLSRVMSSVIDKEEAEYIIYSSDLVNVKDIAGKTSIPTYSKWMHGILGTTSSWKSGFWILHNNLLFPALKNGVLTEPGSKAWYATTVGDSSADIFYICLTAENKGNITEMLISIMAGNPFIYKKKLKNYDFIQPYFKEVRPLQTSFGYEMSASMFLDCMYTPRKNVSTNCLFTYAVTTGVGINVFTRPRGMIKHSSAFCYDDQSLSVFDFLKLERSSSLKSGFTHSMFALSDRTGTTCFGQDVAANAETVAVMICATLPRVHMNIIKSARLTQWSCRRKNKNLMHNTEISNFPVMQQTPFSKPSMEKNEGGKTSNTAIAYTTDAHDEKNETKFCQMFDCNINEDSQNKQEMVDIDALKSPFMKNQKTADWFNVIANDVKMQHIIENPRKKQKINKQTNYNVNKVKGSLEVSKFLLKNVNAVLGLFCREGCRFCQNAKEQFIWLAKFIQIDDFDFVIVDITEPSLPDYLQVPFTPYIRYKPSGLSKWIDYSGEKYEIENIANFLHATAKRSVNDDGMTDAYKNTSTNIKDLSNYRGVRVRKRRETREFLNGQSSTLGSKKEAKLRLKRNLGVTFIEKHIWPYDSQYLPTEERVKHEFDIVRQADNRLDHTFIVTRHYKSTLDQLDYRTKYLRDHKQTRMKGKLICFDNIETDRINAVLFHAAYKNGAFVCGYGYKEVFNVCARHKPDFFTVNHFDSKHYVEDLNKCQKEHFVQGTCKKQTVIST